jgi:hypothetical protein
MLGTIEDLEKEIEQFHNNIAASNELYTILKQIADSIEKQHSDFNAQTSELLVKVETLPETIENANAESNVKIKSGVESKLNEALQTFENEQGKYISELAVVKQRLQESLNHIKDIETSFISKSNKLLSEIEMVPSKILEDNTGANNALKDYIAMELSNALQKWEQVQNNYIKEISVVKQQLNETSNQIITQENSFVSKLDEILAIIENVPSRILDDNTRTNTVIKCEIDQILAERNRQFTEEQVRYISMVQSVQNEIKNCEVKLETKYNEFISKLEQMNISNLYEQNKQLKDELNKKITILTVIAIVSVIVGIIAVIL